MITRWERDGQSHIKMLRLQRLWMHTRSRDYPGLHVVKSAGSGEGSYALTYAQDDKTTGTCSPFLLFVAVSLATVPAMLAGDEICPPRQLSSVRQ